MAPRERKDAVDVIAVFMRHCDTGKIGGRQPETRKAPFGFADRHAAIDHQPGVACFDNQRIALTATAQRCETHHRAGHLKWRFKALPERNAAPANTSAAGELFKLIVEQSEDLDGRAG